MPLLLLYIQDLYPYVYVLDALYTRTVVHQYLSIYIYIFVRVWMEYRGYLDRLKETDK